MIFSRRIKKWQIQRVLSRIFHAREIINVGGSIINLPIGNTEVIAKKIQELTGSDTFQIKTVKILSERLYGDNKCSKGRTGEQFQT